MNCSRTKYIHHAATEKKEQKLFFFIRRFLRLDFFCLCQTLLKFLFFLPFFSPNYKIDGRRKPNGFTKNFNPKYTTNIEF